MKRLCVLLRCKTKDQFLKHARLSKTAQTCSECQKSFLSICRLCLCKNDQLRLKDANGLKFLKMAINLMTKLLNVDFRRRFTAAQAIDDDFFKMNFMDEPLTFN